MFNKALFICLLAAYSIQPNGAILPLGAVEEDVAADMAIRVGATAHDTIDRALRRLADVQATMQTFNTSGIRPQIWETYNPIIASEVVRIGGNQSKLPRCLENSFKSLEEWVMQFIRNECLTTLYATKSIDTLARMANNLDNVVENMKNLVAAACRPAAAGDVVGAVCAKVASASVSEVVASQAGVVSAYVKQTNSLVAEISAVATDIPTCVQNRILQHQYIIGGIVDCTTHNW